MQRLLGMKMLLFVLGLVAPTVLGQVRSPWDRRSNGWHRLTCRILLHTFNRTRTLNAWWQDAQGQKGVADVARREAPSKDVQSDRQARNMYQFRC